MIILQRILEKNYFGSCGYVAMGMMLSYYDTFLDDNLIPEQYDVNSIGTSTDMNGRRNSPGIVRDRIYDKTGKEIGGEMSAAKYKAWVQSNKETSFHAKLISYGIARNYYSSEEENYCNTNFRKRYNILNDYLSDELNYSLDTDYTYYYYNAETAVSKSDEVRQFAIQKIREVYPVMLSIADNNENGHVVVAYDYDEELDELYCHFGWDAASTHVTIESQNYVRYKTALSISFYQEHSHTNNYAVIDGNDDASYYCYHSCKIDTHSNTNKHTYTYKYEKSTSDKHLAYCECGEYKEMKHSIDTSTITSSGVKRYGNCKYCYQTIILSSGYYPIVF